MGMLQAETDLYDEENEVATHVIYCMAVLQNPDPQFLDNYVNHPLPRPLRIFDSQYLFCVPTESIDRVLSEMRRDLHDVRPITEAIRIDYAALSDSYRVSLADPVPVLVPIL